MPEIDFNQLIADNGPVEELALDLGLIDHIIERVHDVSLTEIREVHQLEHRIFANRPDKRAPLVMVGPTKDGRILCIPIEPTDVYGVWKVVTAFTANKHDVERYQKELGNG